MKLCTLIEGKILGIDESLSNYCINVSRGEFEKALMDLEKTILEFKQSFLKESRKIFGFKIRLEAPEPKIRSERVHTGLWSGVYEYIPRNGKEPIYIVIEPRVEKYYEMLKDIRETLHTYRDFQLLVGIAPAIHPSLVALEVIRRLLYEIQNIVDREPKYIASKISNESGEYIEISAGIRGLEIKPYTIKKTLNEPLAFTTAIALKSIARAIQRLKSVSEEIKHYSGTNTIVKVLEEYLYQINRFLQLLLSEEFIAYSLSVFDTVDFERIDVEKYWYVLRMSKMISLVTRGVRGFSGSLRAFLLPSTKIYELFVYSNIVKQLGGRVEEISGSRLALKVDSSRLYFNHYPRTMLRLIKDLTKRIPSPDILYVSRNLLYP